MMNKVALEFPKAGESKLQGYGGKLIDFTIEKQLLDAEKWTLFVEQFRVRWDGNNGGWRGEYWGKMMRGAALTYRATKNEKLYSVMVDTINDLLTTQDELGRISAYAVDREFRCWDIWARKYVMLGMCYFLDICKSKTLARKIINAMKRHANYIVKHIGDGKKQKTIFQTSGIWGSTNSCSILEPFVKLHVLTGEKKYLDFATYLVNTGFNEEFNLIETCLNKTLYPYQFPTTKAYEMMSCFEGLIEYYKVTGNPDHLQAVENFVELLAESDYTIIGCSGCYHELLDNSSKTQTEPAVETVMQETCVTVTFLKLCAKLLSLTGKAKYADYVEKSGLNALYGAVNNEEQQMTRTGARTWDSDGTMHLVTLLEPFPFDSYSPLFHDERGKRVGGCQIMQDGKSYGCCVCIGSAGTAIMGLFAVMKNADGVYVNLYNDCRFKTEDLFSRISNAKKIALHPLKMTAVCANGKIKKALAFNEVSLLRQSRQAADIRISVDGIEKMPKLVCDGILVSTPAGSTAYNYSVHGPILPLTANVLALTPISAFRPRRWHGALLPAQAKVTLKILQNAKRPVSAVADFTQIRNVETVDVEQEASVSPMLMFDADYSLEDRILNEQFTT